MLPGHEMCPSYTALNSKGSFSHVAGPAFKKNSTGTLMCVGLYMYKMYQAVDGETYQNENLCCKLEFQL